MIHQIYVLSQALPLLFPSAGLLRRRHARNRDPAGGINSTGMFVDNVLGSVSSRRKRHRPLRTALVQKAKKLFVFNLSLAQESMSWATYR